MIVERLKQQGTSHCSNDLLKICVKTGASWSAQAFKQADEMPSGPEAFLVFCFLKARLTSSTQTLSSGWLAGGEGSGSAGGDGGCVKCRSERVCGVNEGFSNLQ